MTTLLLAILYLTALLMIVRGVMDRYAAVKRGDGKNDGGGGMLEGLIRMMTREAPVGDQNTNPGAVAKPTYVDPAMPGLPGTARVHVETINGLLTRIAARTTTDVAMLPLIVEVDALRDRHLPKLVGSYVAIPAEHRVAIFAETGRSASVHLSESLAVMADRLKEIDRDLSRASIDRFSDNNKFIGRTYGREEDPLG